jgi:hypothetical protein
MGYWGTGAFQSDTALDFLGEVDDLSGDNQRVFLEQTIDKPAEEWDHLGIELRCASITLKEKFGISSPRAIERLEKAIKHFETEIIPTIDYTAPRRHNTMDEREIVAHLKAELAYVKGEGPYPDSPGLFTTMFKIPEEANDD